MKNLIVANWKMNPQTYIEAEGLIKNIIKHVKGLGSIDIVICPPFTWLTDFSHKNKSSLSFGAQDVFYEEKGAYTGEISPEMLKSSGVDYVIVGHSERRKYFNETDEIINKKIKKALEVGLKTILCIGETSEERRAGSTNEILEKQIRQGLLGVENLENLIIAYEPVWAIGTGNNCSIEDAKTSIDFIRKFVKPDLGVLYGGSINSENSGAYIKEAGANGLLVGGSSLDAAEFVKIVKSAE